MAGHGDSFRQQRSEQVLEILLKPPFGQEKPAAARVAIGVDPERRDTVEAEMPEVLPRLAPGGQDLGLPEESDRDRPDDALARSPLFVRIAEVQAPLLLHRRAQRGEMRGAGAAVHAGEQGAIACLEFGLRRHGGEDLGQRVLGRLVEHRVAALGDEAQAEQERVHLVLAEAQGRQEESGAEDIAETGLTLDDGALGLESSDVAIEGAQRNADLLGQIGAADRMPPSAQSLEQVEQAGGTGQRGNSLARKPSVGRGDPGWQAYRAKSRKYKENGGPDTIRTYDLCLRSNLACPSTLFDRFRSDALCYCNH